MREWSVEIETDEGRMPTFVVAPDGTDVTPGLLVYMDVFGPRGELFDICRRFASCGYVVLMPQLFYRLGSPVFPPVHALSDQVSPAAQRANAATGIAATQADTPALLRFLDRGGAGRRVPCLGTVGYCMGGRHALAAAAAVPDRIAFAASIHGGRLVTPDDQSPHLLIERFPGHQYFAFARDDDTCPETQQRIVEQVALQAGSRVHCERYQALHGWSFPQRWCFDRRASEQVYERVLQLARATLWTKHQPR